MKRFGLAIVFCLILSSIFNTGVLAQTTTPTPTPGATINSNTALRNMRYCEILPVVLKQGKLVASVYNTLGQNDCPLDAWKAMDVNAIKKQFGALEVLLNGPRFWMMDQIIGKGATQAGETVTIGGLGFTKRAELVLTLTSMKSIPYEVREIERDTTYVFQTGKPVYQLVDPSGLTYVMQTYSQQVDSDLTMAQLDTLGARLKLPKGWKYQAVVLDHELTLTANGLAHLVQDDFDNSYQRLDATVPATPAATTPATSQAKNDLSRASRLVSYTSKNNSYLASRPNYLPVQLPTLQQMKLLAFDKASSDSFGYSVALSADKNTALVGAYLEDDSGTTNNGAVYVYVRSGEAWTLQTKLFAADKASNDTFGSAVTLSADGNTALIGASGESDSGTTSNGAAFVFTRSGTTWTQQAKLLAADKASSDSFGYSVTLSSDGNTGMVGAPSKSDSGTTSNGAAYVFTRSGTTWTQQAKLLAADKASSDGFALVTALSTDGNTALIGAYGKSDNGLTSNGAAYVFTRSGTTWTQQSKLLAADKASTDLFGISVALSSDGNTALIGADLEDDSGTSGNGAAYVFTRSGATWTQQAKLLAADKANNDDFGQSVALSANGNIALIGAVFEDDPSNTNNGAAYLFTRSGTTWSQQAKLLAADKASDDYFGRSVALSADGNTALIGAYMESDSGTTNNGAVYVFNDPTPIPTATATNSPTPTVTATPSSTSTFTATPVPPRPDTIGVYKDGVFYLRNSNTGGAADITAVFGGNPADLPVVGDWNGDGVDTIGVYNSSSGVFSLSDSNTTPTTSYTLVFGNPGDAPFAGHWTIDMTGSGVGVYRNSNGILYQRKSLTSGFDDFFAVFGNPGDLPVAGDWDSNGFDSIGIYRPAVQTWYLTNNSQPNGITFSDIDFVWDISNNTPIAGDWDGNGSTTPGILTANGVFTLLSANGTAGSYSILVFGPTNSKPIAGKWVVAGNPSFSSVVHPAVAQQVGDTDSRNAD